MTREEEKTLREELLEDHTPYDDWREFIQARDGYINGDKDQAS